MRPLVLIMFKSSSYVKASKEKDGYKDKTKNNKLWYAVGKL